MIPVTVESLPDRVRRMAEHVGLVQRGIVQMDETPLYGGVCIYAFDHPERPVLIGQRSWTRAYHVEMPVDWNVLDSVINSSEAVERCLRNAARRSYSELSKATFILVRYIDSLRAGEDKTRAICCLFKMTFDAGEKFIMRSNQQ